MSESLVGDYLGREVRVSGVSDLIDGLSPGALSHAVVLIWLSHELGPSTVISRLSTLVSATPLVLFIGGSDSEPVFEALLQYLDSISPPPQIMTRWSADSLDECVAELLQATWPSEDQMDLWTSYRLAADDESGVLGLVAATADLCQSELL